MKIILKMAVRNMQLSIDQLAQYVFVDHDARLTIDLSVIQGIDVTKDLFFFCLDLLCKGLVLLFGTENRVVVEELTASQFQHVNDRLKLMGIECKLEVTPLVREVSMHERLSRMAAMYTMPENMLLQDYNLELVGNKSIFKISFHLFHNTGSTPCPRA